MHTHTLNACLIVTSSSNESSIDGHALLSRNELCNVPLEVLSDDASDPVALARIYEELQKAHDLEGRKRHPSSRVMEQCLRLRFYLHHLRPFIGWFKGQCEGCRKKVLLLIQLSLNSF